MLYWTIIFPKHLNDLNILELIFNPRGTTRPHATGWPPHQTRSPRLGEVLQGLIHSPCSKPVPLPLLKRGPCATGCCGRINPAPTYAPLTWTKRITRITSERSTRRVNMSESAPFFTSVRTGFQKPFRSMMTSTGCVLWGLCPRSAAGEQGLQSFGMRRNGAASRGLSGCGATPVKWPFHFTSAWGSNLSLRAITFRRLDPTG